MSTPLLVCSDLDRTLLPNGEQAESPAARPLFARLAAHPEVRLAYVTGRHLGLLREALERYALPLPGFAVCDVGTSIYRRRGDAWQLDEDWAACLEADWRGCDTPRLQRLLLGLKGLRLQDESKQGRFKLSYYAPVDLAPQQLLAEIASRLAGAGVRASLVWSIDETVPLGLLDILPRSAGKLAAIEFLRQGNRLAVEQILFAGDSGNDLPVLASRIPAVLVANATAAVRQEALRLVRLAGHSATLYLARGGYRGLNGNYAGGILEGAVHYHPWLDSWLNGVAQ